MNVLHVSASLSRNAGGIFEVALSIAKHLAARGVEVSAAGLVDEAWPTDACRWSPVPTKAFRHAGPTSFGYSNELSAHIRRSTCDVVHLHSMWMYPSLAVSKWSRSTGRPYFLTPNGMLEPWALSNSRWKKILAGVLYENSMLRNASCIQASTLNELKNIRAFGLHNPVAIIPNGIELPALAETREKPAGPIMLFLGRIHPKKGIDNAIRAWRERLNVQPSSQRGGAWKLIVAGWDQGGHEAELKQLCADIGLPYADVPAENLDPMALPPVPLIFTGPAFGSAKEKLLRVASAFILPSHSEGLPMSVLEAWSYGLPVLMTDQCNIPEGFSAGAAFRIEAESGSIGDAVEMLARMNPTQLDETGANGRRLVEERFTWNEVTARLIDVYRWITGRGTIPSCVVFDR